MPNYYEEAYPAGQPARRARRSRIPLIVLAAALIAALACGAAYLIRRAVTKTIAVVPVYGTISSYSASPFDTASYDHAFLIGAIDRLIHDGSNQAILLDINSPGGGVYETDELYLKLMEYRETTGRPVYAYFGSEAASGGYYAAMAAEWIVCNRNCMTGSIGVRMNTILDMTGLLDKFGIEAVTITSGENKAMGDSYSKLTGEQKDILQSYVDESYEQFVGIVASGRPDLTLEEIRKLADGRIYTAGQALDNGLVDEIGSYDDALEALQEDYALGGCGVRFIQKDAASSLFSALFSAARDLRPKNEVESCAELLAEARRRSGYYCALTR